MDTWIRFFQKYSNFQINSFSGYWDIKILSRVVLGVGVSVGLWPSVIINILLTINLAVSRIYAKWTVPQP